MSLRPSLELVVIMGCLSDRLGARLAAAGLPTVAWRSVLSDAHAAAFSVAFFQALNDLDWLAAGAESSRAVGAIGGSRSGRSRSLLLGSGVASPEEGKLLWTSRTDAMIPCESSVAVSAGVNSFVADASKLYKLDKNGKMLWAKKAANDGDGSFSPSLTATPSGRRVVIVPTVNELMSLLKFCRPVGSRSDSYSRCWC